MPFALLALTLAAAPAGQGDPKADGTDLWRFVLPAPGDAFEHPPFRALVLSREKPEDLSEVDLFVDANRDRKIDDRDQVAGTKSRNPPAPSSSPPSSTAARSPASCAPPQCSR